MQEVTGKLVGGKALQAKGPGKQILGEAENTYGDAKYIIKNGI